MEGRKGDNHGTVPYIIQALKVHLAEALKMLNVIKNGYSTFHSAMLKESKKLPVPLVSELDSYDAAICLHLGVVRETVKQSRSVRTGGGGGGQLHNNSSSFEC